MMRTLSNAGKKLLMTASLGLIGMLTSCGSDDKKAAPACDPTQTEIDNVAATASSYGTAGAIIDITTTIKSQCPEVVYQGVYTLKEGSAPTNCTDGSSKIAGSTVMFAGAEVKIATKYFLRACVTTSGFTSTGVTKEILTP